jgi:O-antigen ligase
LSATGTTLDRAEIDRALIWMAARGAVFLGVFLTGFVLIEPSPHEVVLAGLIGIWALTGMRISRTTAPLLILLVLFVCGGMLSLTQMEDLYDAPTYLAVSFFLGMTAVFYATLLEQKPDFYRVIARAWVCAGLGTGALGVLGYFGLIPGDFTVFGRASGAFKDPNVFGPYLAFPATYLLYRLLTGNALRMPFHAAAFLFLLLATFLSFSRGAWGVLFFCCLSVTAILFVRSRSAAFRLRLIVMSAIAAVSAAVAILVALQIPAVADLFAERAQLVQSYDGARLGRFGRYGIGFLMAMENPLGIGILEFGRIFGEDPHNIWLKTLVDYSWLGFAAFLVLVFSTIVGGFRILLRERPWQPFLLCAYVVFIGQVLLGTVIDLNHWRHFYLLLGMIWGAMALEARHQRRLDLQIS